MDLKALVGNNMKLARLRLGLTQEEVATKMGVDVSYAARAERGEQNLTLESLDRAAAALKLKARDLLEDGEIVPSAKKAAAELDEAIQLLQRVRTRFSK